VNDLPRVATRQCGGRESNPRPVDCKSSALTTTLPSHTNSGVKSLGYFYSVNQEIPMGQLITDNHVSCNNNNKQTNNAAIFLGQTACKPYQNSTILDFIGAKGDGGGEW